MELSHEALQVRSSLSSPVLASVLVGSQVIRFDPHFSISIWPMFNVRRLFIHPSLTLQMDAIIYSIFRLRLERDICSPDGSSRYCITAGPWPWASPASVGFGLYAPQPSQMSAVLQLVFDHRGSGLFVGPILLDHGPLLPFSGESWYRTLRKYSLLSFWFDGPSFYSCASSRSCPWFGFVVSFASKSSRPRRRNREEKVFHLTPIPDLPVPVICDRPFSALRISPDCHIPDPSMDTSPPSLSFPLADVFVPTIRVSSWNIGLLSMFARHYPFADVAALAIAGASSAGTVSSFVGDRTKCVLSSNMVDDISKIDLLFSRFSEEVSKGRMAGPFGVCPFPNSWCSSQPRIQPVGCVPKDKWDPLSSRFRSVINVSSHGDGSVNNLCYSPRLIGAHLQAWQIRDKLFDLGRDAQASLIDIVDAFRMNILSSEDLHLFVYSLSNSFFVDLRHPFGFIPSEWTFASISAILRWAFSLPQYGIVPDPQKSHLDTYVDNFYLFSVASDPSHGARASILFKFLADLGCVLHERQEGPVFEALGWEWDLHLFIFSCPIEKHRIIGDRLHEWCVMVASGSPLCSKSVEQVVGFLWWASAACHHCVPLIYNLSCARAECGGSDRPLRLKPSAAYSLFAIEKFWRSWNRQCPIYHGFSPSASFLFLVHSDASTETGCGGWVAQSGLCFSHKWSSHERSCMLEGYPPGPPTLQRASSAFCELLAIEYSFYAFGESMRGCRVQFQLDSEPAYKALIKGHSPSPHCLGLLSRIRELESSLTIISRYAFVPREHNTVADCLSNDDMLQASRVAADRFGVKLHQVSVRDLSPVPVHLEDIILSYRS